MGTKLFLKHARFQVRDLYLWPDGNREQSGLRGGVGSLDVVSVLCVRILWLRSDRFGVGGPITFEALCVMLVSLFLFVSIEKKQDER